MASVSVAQMMLLMVYNWESRKVGSSACGSVELKGAHLVEGTASRLVEQTACSAAAQKDDSLVDETARLTAAPMAAHHWARLKDAKLGTKRVVLKVGVMVARMACWTVLRLAAVSAH